MPKHVHADLIAEYAKLAQVTDKPWEYFEFRCSDYANWDKCEVDISFFSTTQYRLKPRTIKIGEYDVPEPYKGELNFSQPFYYPCIDCHDKFVITAWWCKENKEYMHLMKNGLIHLDRESAELHAKALIALTAK
ncbi:hypothetical protein [Xenorhabdus sp. SGI246]|uniref:hypothetical protein n=1 Tax=Xenorhabdus sp. SGI246 TaxID=3158263 RepID=UPI00349F9F3B